MLPIKGRAIALLDVAQPCQQQPAHSTVPPIGFSITHNSARLLDAELLVAV
ncbi:MAG: hypothetical protein KME31_31935 [Tolypothrix carrinoi HA7290-LM1]|nr:hypothetical protein [Tolypothrix carrinoi HA7290-LM1]